MKVVYFGGTFDPIHEGHIQLADAAVRDMGLDELYFMPNFISPFKTQTKHAKPTDRLEMVKLILHYNDAFRVTTYELYKAGLSFTFNTLKELEILNKEHELYFLLGFDSLVKIDTWFRGKEILSNYRLVTGVRPGTTFSLGLKKIQEYQKKYNADITIINSDFVDISSTDIRDRVSQNLSLEGLVKPEVEEYIYEHDLYKN